MWTPPRGRLAFPSLAALAAGVLAVAAGVAPVHSSSPAPGPPAAPAARVAARAAPPATVPAEPAPEPVTTDGPVEAAAPPPPTPAPTSPPPAPAPAPAAVPSPPPPAPPPPAPPPPAPAPAPGPGDPGPGDPVARTLAALEASVPAAWRADLGVALVVVPGTLSLSNADGTLKIGAVAAAGAWGTLRFVVVHEWAHQVAFHYGSQAFPGAPPAGFPYAGAHPEELWADCVARGLTGVSLATTGQYPECTADQAGWARGWLGEGPGDRARTR